MAFSMILLAACLFICSACAFFDHPDFLGKWQVQNSSADIYFTFNEDTLVTDAGTMHYKLSDPNTIEFSTDSGKTGDGTYELSEDKQTLSIFQTKENGKIECTTLKKVAELQKENPATQAAEQNNEQAEAQADVEDAAPEQATEETASQDLAAVE